MDRYNPEVPGTQETRRRIQAHNRGRRPIGIGAADTVATIGSVGLGNEVSQCFTFGIGEGSAGTGYQMRPSAVLASGMRSAKIHSRHRRIELLLWGVFMK
jgi:hypothetical protein